VRDAHTVEAKITEIGYGVRIRLRA